MGALGGVGNAEGEAAKKAAVFESGRLGSAGGGGGEFS